MESAPGKDDQGGIRRLAYARSKDGIHWERPPLGLVDLPGVGSKNNLLITSRAGPTGSNNGRVDLDLHPPSPDRRFVMIYEDAVSEAIARQIGRAAFCVEAWSQALRI